MNQASKSCLLASVRRPLVFAVPTALVSCGILRTVEIPKSANPLQSYDGPSTSTGQRPAPELDGVNRLPHLRGEDKGPPHKTLYWRWVDQAAIQEYPFKLVLLGRKKSLLFDITEPGKEIHTRELSSRHPEIVTRLCAKLDAWLTTLNPPGPPKPLLREAGYIRRKTAKYQISLDGATTGNSIQALSTACIQALSVSGLDISDNQLSLSSAASAGAKPLSVTNSVNETVSGNSMR